MKGRVMPKHTPGPWKCISDSSYGISVVDEKGRRIAWCGTGLPPIKPRAIDTGEAANATLIKAAPDLLAELKRLQSVVGEEDHDIIQEVIDRAEGQ